VQTAEVFAYQKDPFKIEMKWRINYSCGLSIGWLVVTPVYVPLSQNADLFTKAVQSQVVAFAVPRLSTP